QQVAAYVRRALAGETVTTELPYEDRFYEYNFVPIREQGAIVFAMILALNVTARRRAQDEHKKSEERFERMFRDSPEAMLVTRKGDGAVVEMNSSFLDMFGYSREEVIGKTTLELGLWPEAADRAAILEQVNQRGRLDSVEITLRRKDGARVTGVTSTRPFEF